ncbi:hypothetical protein [Actinoplanes sp. CA-252034]|uniref:hypothetical protein n=1 Tax=Actinoplanes sp. CA-252034 TaxID=3239906 RepID=UPI003D9558F5
MDVINRVPGLGRKAAVLRQQTVDNAPSTAPTCGEPARTCPRSATRPGRTRRDRPQTSDVSERNSA